MSRRTFQSMAVIESMSNEQVGAACKGLILTWLISADECREQEPVHKLAEGVDALLMAQGQGRDTEFDMHLIGYCDDPGNTQHDVDQFTTPAHHQTKAAGKELTKLVAYIFRNITLTGHGW